VEVGRRQEDAQAKIAGQLAEVGFALPGSLTVKAYKCGKRNCRCKADPPRLHGPYAFWTRKVAGKTVTRMLGDEELAAYRPMFDNARKIRELVDELYELSLELVEDKPPAPSKTARRTARPGEGGPEPSAGRRSRAGDSSVAESRTRRSAQK
jgi:hypothetical protein